MDQGLTEVLKIVPPWLAAVVMMFLGRKEIVALFTASNKDRAVEGLLSEMNRQFAANMELFHVTNEHLSAAKENITQILQVARDIHSELLRGQK